MVKVLLIGSSGLVGRHVLSRTLDDPRFNKVIALTRRNLPGHPKLLNQVVDFEHLPPVADWWAVDGVISTIGTTSSKAGSREAFRKIDHDYPLAVARMALEHGATRFALNSALGADASSRVFYNRIKGDLEDDLTALGFPSLTLVRPGLIGGDRSEFRLAEQAGIMALRALGGLLPRRFRVNPADKIAEVLVDAIGDGRPGRRIVSSDELV